MQVEEHNDVLSQPTRSRLFGTLRALKRPASTKELSDLTGLHPNGIRNHLEVMFRAGYLVRDSERRGRGRPRVLWAIDPTAHPGGEALTGYSELSEWLVRAVERGIRDPDGIEDLGHSIGMDLTRGDAEPGGDPEARFRDALAAMGFQPERQEEAVSGEVTYCLANCPYRDTARTGQALICGLHRGITAGLIESFNPDARLTRFVAKDPDRAGCLISATGLGENPKD